MVVVVAAAYVAALVDVAAYVAARVVDVAALVVDVAAVDGVDVAAVVKSVGVSLH